MEFRQTGCQRGLVLWPCIVLHEGSSSDAVSECTTWAPSPISPLCILRGRASDAMTAQEQPGLALFLLYLPLSGIPRSN